MHEKYRYAISTAIDASESAPILLVGSIAENLKKASELGYDAIEIHLRENECIDYDNLIRLCKQYNVKVSAIVTGRLHTQENVSLTDESPDNIDRVISGLKQYIEIAEKFDTDIIIGWIRGKVTGKQSKADFERTLASNLKIISEYANQRNVKVYIEAINRYEVNSLNRAEEILELIEKFSLINTYVHLDTFHMNIEEVDLADAIMLCGDKLGYMHFADSNRNYPGKGHIDFKKVLNSLKAIGYTGYLSIECLPIPSREDSAKAARETLEKIINGN